MTPQRKTQISVTGVSLGLALAHLIWPAITIDAITLTLLAAAAIPWLLPILKSLELPGGVKVEFQELRAAGERAAEAGLLDDSPDSPATHDYSFQLVADEDPNLALAGLRIEIERRLARLAETTGKGGHKIGVGRSIRLLGNEGVISPEQGSGLADMVGLLNSAVHGAKVDRQSANWALDVGPRLLATLDRRIAEP